MANSIFEVIKNSVLGKRFRNIGYLPRWIIFAIDVFIVFVASIITYVIIYSLTGVSYYNVNMSARYGVIIFMNATFFFLFPCFRSKYCSVNESFLSWGLPKEV